MALMEIHPEVKEAIERRNIVLAGNETGNEAPAPVDPVDTVQQGVAHRGRDIAYKAVKYGLAALGAYGGYLAAEAGGNMAGVIGGITGAVTLAWGGGKLGLQMRGHDTEGLGAVLNAGMIGAIGLALGTYLGVTTSLQGGLWAQVAGTATGGAAGYAIGKLLTALHKSQQ